jgi:hypothetical protein
MARGYFMAKIKFYLPKFLLRKDLLNSHGCPLRLTFTTYTQVVVKTGEDYAATRDYSMNRVSVSIKNRLISRVDIGRSRRI